MRRRAAPVLFALLALAGAAMAAAPPPDGAVVAINVLLEPDAALRERALALNAQLRAVDAAGFALDAGHTVHLTVLQCYVRRADLAAALAAVAAVAGRARVAGLELEATGLYATPFGGRSLLAMRVAPAAALGDFQAALVAALAPYAGAAATASAFLPEAGGPPVGAGTVAYVRDFVAAASGSRYQPHVTVGAAAPQATAPLLAAPFAPLRFRVARVAVYQLGDFGTARRRLWP